VNFHLIKNLYDSLIEYTPEGEAVPSLATEWTINADNTSVTLKLRDDVTFASGGKFSSADVVATLEKAANPDLGKNVFGTMAIVKDWAAPDATTITINFKAPVPTKQITDLLQFMIPIEAAGIATVETVPAGTGAYLLADRAVGQGLTMKKNPNYWRDNEPILDEIVFTIFADDAAASAALESGSIDMVYGSTARNAVRLQDAGYQVIRGPGSLVQVFRINATRAPFTTRSSARPSTTSWTAGHGEGGLCRSRHRRGAALGSGLAGVRRGLYRRVRLQHGQGQGAVRGLGPVGPPR
jgi:peptide/nickel transport system substrate-binding protein